MHEGRWIPYVIYASFSLAILAPLSMPGVILTLDSPYALISEFKMRFWGLNEFWILPSLPFDTIIHVIGGFIPAWLLQKILIFLIFFLCGVGVHRLLPRNGLGSYFAGLLYMINPFTYVRFLVGQWDILSAYALIPFAVKSFIDLLNHPNLRNVIKFVLLATLVGIIEVQGYLMLVLACFIIFLTWVVKEYRQRTTIVRTSKYLVIGGVAFCILNFYWLIPTLAAKANILSQISQADITMFAPKATSRIMLDIASMYGFWRSGYISPQNMFPFWWVPFLIILFLAVYGTITQKSVLRWLSLSFTIIGIASFVLAVGISSKITQPFFVWLWQNIYLFHGFRDSQKFVGLLCLAYAFLGGLGLNQLIQDCKDRHKFKGSAIILSVFALLTILVYSFPIFGFPSQIRATDYPTEWYAVNNYLSQDKEDFNVLFLPWHLYMDYSWLPNRDKRLTNPASLFFDKPVIAGDNIEVPGIDSQSTNPISKYVEFVLGNGGSIDNLGELLAPVNVKYVILVNEADYESYNFLYQQADLNIVLEKTGITLFKNEHSTARAYEVDSLVYIDSLEEYLELSKTQDVMAHLYVIGSGQSDDGNTQMGKLTINAKSPVNYQVEGATKQYTVFAVPQNVNTEYWEFNGQPPVAKNLGFMPAFTSSYDGGEIVYTRFYRVYLPCYIISALTLSLMVYLYFRSRKGRASGI